MQAGGLEGCKHSKSFLFRSWCAAKPRTTRGKKGVRGRLHLPLIPLHKSYFDERYTPMRIWIDADACPKDVKELVFRASSRLSLPVCLVANRTLALPPSSLITQVRVKPGSDVADGYIVQHVEAADIVVTADIPLAAQVVARG